MLKRPIALLVILVFTFSNFQYVHAQDFSVNQLPVPGTMVGVSSPYSPLALKGLIVDPQRPMEFQFIVDTGLGTRDMATIKEGANQLVKYFLAGLTIPENDLWVNLSPYEKDRMVPMALGQTDLGRDLLAQDYILKQLTASLIYPEKDLGKEFWNRVYTKAQEQFGSTDIPVNTFNKVWILPDQAQVFENVNAAYVTKSTLKVMLDEDYTALFKHSSPQNRSPASVGNSDKTHTLASQIVREIVLPEIEKEVNTGKNFAPLRQIYQALILAKWYKITIQNGLLDAVYMNKNKTNGVNVDNPAIKEQIYNRYLQAYKKGVFNYIKEDPAPNGQTIERKYFSGGTRMVFTLDEKGTRPEVEAVGPELSFRVALKNAAMSAVSDPSLFNELTFPEQADFRQLIMLNQSFREKFKEASLRSAPAMDKNIDEATQYLRRTLFPPKEPRNIPIKTMIIDKNILPLGYAIDRDTGTIYLNQNFDMNNRFNFLTRKCIFILSPDPNMGREKEYRFALSKDGKGVTALFPSTTSEPNEIIEKKLKTQILISPDMTTSEALTKQAKDITGNPDIKIDTQVSAEVRRVNFEAYERAKQMLYLIGVNALDRVTDYTRTLTSLDEVKTSKLPILAGQLSSKFAPITLAHMVVTILSTYALTGVNTFYVNVSKVDPRKPEVYKTFKAREELARKVIDDFFGGLVQVIPNNEKIEQWNGEEVLIEMLKEAQLLPDGQTHRFVYTAGSDHFFVFAPFDKNDSIPSLIAFDKVTDIEPLNTEKYYTYYMKLFWSAYKELVIQQQEYGKRKIFKDVNHFEQSERDSWNKARMEDDVMRFRQNFYEAVINSDTWEDFAKHLQNWKDLGRTIYLPRLDTVGKMYIAEHAPELQSKAKITLAHTFRSEDYKDDSLRDKLIRDNEVTVVDVPGLKGDIAATKTRAGLQLYASTAGKLFSYSLLYGNVISLLKAILNPKHRDLLYLFLRQEETETPKALQALLPDGNGSDYGEKERNSMAALRAKLSASQEFIEEKKEIDPARPDEVFYSNITVTENNKPVATLEYNVKGKFVEGRDINILQVRSAKGTNVKLLHALLDYARDSNGTDSAMESNLRAASSINPLTEYGGIDFNRINVNRAGKSVIVQFDPEQIDELKQDNFKGFTFDITDMKFIQSPFPLLGVNLLKESEKLAKA